MKDAFEKLVKVNKECLEKCPWDKVQTLESFQGLIKDEAEEISEAIAKKDWENLKEEIGDVLHNLIFLTHIAEKKGLFTLEDAINYVVDKLIRRHPHVFGDEKCETPEDAMRIWNRVKQEEKEGKL